MWYFLFIPNHLEWVIQQTYCYVGISFDRVAGSSPSTIESPCSIYSNVNQKTVPQIWIFLPQSKWLEVWIVITPISPLDDVPGHGRCWNQLSPCWLLFRSGNLAMTIITIMVVMIMWWSVIWHHKAMKKVLIIHSLVHLKMMMMTLSIRLTQAWRRQASLGWSNWGEDQI